MICVSIDFNLPLTVTHRLHTCHYRKFVGINIACHTDWSLALKIPEIICVSPTNSVVELTSMNTTCDQLTVSIQQVSKVSRFFSFYLLG